MPPKSSEPKGKEVKCPPDLGGTHPKTRAGSKQTAQPTATVDLTTVQPTQEAEAKSKGKEVAEVEVEDKSESEEEDEEDGEEERRTLCAKADRLQSGRHGDR